MVQCNPAVGGWWNSRAKSRVKAGATFSGALRTRSPKTIRQSWPPPSPFILVDPIFQAFRKKCALPAIRPLNKAPHPIPRNSRRSRIAGFIRGGAFSHSQDQTAT